MGTGLSPAPPLAAKAGCEVTPTTSLLQRAIRASHPLLCIPFLPSIPFLTLLILLLLLRRCGEGAAAPPPTRGHPREPGQRD